MAQVLATGKTLVIIFILVGGLIRFLYPGEWLTFDYDQEVAWSAAAKVWYEGKWTLIGQELSVGGVFIGPLLVYSLVPFVALFHGDPSGMLPWVILVYLLTSLIVWYAGARWFGSTAAIAAVALYGISPLFSFYDRLVAPSTLLAAHSLLALLAFDRILRGQGYGFLLLGIVLGLGVHITPVWLFMVPITTVFLVTHARQYWERSVVSLAIPIAVLGFPLLLFDLRHGFLVTGNAIRVLREGGSEQLLLDRAAFLVQVLISGIGSVVTMRTPLIWGILIFLGIVSVLRLLWYENKTRAILLVLWLLLPAVSFIGYQRHVPEYYVTPTFAIVVLFLGRLVDLGWQRVHIRKILMASGLLLTMVSWTDVSNHKNLMSLKQKQQAVAYIQAHAQGREYQVDFVTQRGLNTGFVYLFSRTSNPPSMNTASPRYTVIVPTTDFGKDSFDVSFGHIGVQHPRNARS